MSDRGPDDAVIPPFSGQRHTIPTRGRVHVKGTMRTFDETTWTGAVSPVDRADDAAIAAMRGCLLAGPGRGDCEHFVGLPQLLDDSNSDHYGVPNGWCIVCWYKARLDFVTKEREKFIANYHAAMDGRDALYADYRAVADAAREFSYQWAHGDDLVGPRARLESVLAAEHPGGALVAVVEAVKAWTELFNKRRLVLGGKRDPFWDACYALAAAVAALPR